MGEYVIKLPDVGEGVAEAELVEWNVKIGDLVREDTVLAAVMTDKATVEIPSPVDGEIIWLGGEIGQVLAIGAARPPEGRGGGQGAVPGRPARAPAAGTAARCASDLRLAKPGARPLGPPAKSSRNRSASRPPRHAVREAPRPEARNPWPRRRFGSGRARRESICARSPGPVRRAASRTRTSMPSSRRIPARRDARPPAADVRRRHQGGRPAPQDRREDGGRQRAHPAYHLCRGGRCHRARGVARNAQQAKAPGAAEAHAPAVPDARDGAGDRGAAAA